MSDQEINIAIAEVCGVFNQPFPRIPDYCQDLNAMHEAEKNLDQEQAQKYTDALSMMPQDKCWAGCTMWHFSSRQRAEAFLRTIGKWKEAAK